MQWGLGQRPGIAVQVADLPGVGSTHGFPLRQSLRDRRAAGTARQLCSASIRLLLGVQK